MEDGLSDAADRQPDGDGYALAHQSDGKLGGQGDQEMSEDSLSPRPRWPLAARLLTRPLLVTVVACAVGLAGIVCAVWMHWEASALRVPAENRALIDLPATERVRSDVRAAVERVYGYSYRSLDANERSARAVVTGPFAEEFSRQFEAVRQLAPQQKAVVAATVVDIAVRSLTGTSAELVVFVDQTLTNAKLREPASTGGRLLVTAQLGAGRWKISDVVSQ